jgi:hydroxyacylglutathione hydrolase
VESSIDVRTSGIWQTKSTVLSRGGACLVVDPAYFPRELDELAALARGRGQVQAVVFTHGHWDHVIGWQMFPGAQIWTSPSLAAAISTQSDVAAQNLAEARDFDADWYVERPAPLRWPPEARALEDGEQIDFGGMKLEAWLLPGHSADGLSLIVEERRLLPGDYLSPCEIPFVEDLHAYRATLKRLLSRLGRLVEVIPGHGPILSPNEAEAIAAADLAYLDGIARAADQRDAAAAVAVPLPRAAGVPGMWGHHLDNCRNAGLDLSAVNTTQARAL